VISALRKRAEFRAFRESAFLRPETNHGDDVIHQGPRRSGERRRPLPAARPRLESAPDPLSVATIAMRARLWALLRGAARAEAHRSSAVRLTSIPGCARVAPPAHRSPWVAAGGAAPAARHLHATSARASMFDAFKSALFGAGASFAIPDAFSLDDLASLSRKVRDERASRGASDTEDTVGPLATLGLTPDQIDAITRALTEQEKARPGLLRPPEHRRVAARRERAAGDGGGSNDKRRNKRRRRERFRERFGRRFGDSARRHACGGDASRQEGAGERRERAHQLGAVRGDRRAEPGFGDEGGIKTGRDFDGRRVSRHAAVSVPERAKVQELLLAAQDDQRTGGILG
jgi:hypothetical protein